MKFQGFFSDYRQGPNWFNVQSNILFDHKSKYPGVVRFKKSLANKLGKELKKIEEIEKLNDPKYKWNKCNFPQKSFAYLHKVKRENWLVRFDEVSSLFKNSKKHF